jgi:hypothetical protein
VAKLRVSRCRSDVNLDSGLHSNMARNLHLEHLCPPFLSCSISCQQRLPAINYCIILLTPGRCPFTPLEPGFRCQCSAVIDHPPSIVQTHAPIKLLFPPFCWPGFHNNLETERKHNPMPYSLIAEPQEIIEFPSILLNARTLRIEDSFRVFCRPEVHSTLTPFCTGFTGIRQDQVCG